MDTEFDEVRDLMLKNDLLHNLMHLVLNILCKRSFLYAKNNKKALK